MICQKPVNILVFLFADDSNISALSCAVTNIKSNLMHLYCYHRQIEKLVCLQAFDISLM